jgi:uncharacterized cofD-like protein
MRKVGRAVSVPRWLHLGMSIKRWLVLLLVGITLLSLGAGYLLRALYGSGLRFPSWAYYLTLQFLGREVRGGLFVALGALVTAVALVRLNRTVITALLPRGSARIVDLLYQQRQLSRGPKVVAIGGGTGLSILLAGLKQHTGNLTAIVTVADDGGSSGRLRRALRILPPGDFRQCIVALADVEPLMAALLQYRFRQGSGLDGHTLGNLLLAAMAEITGNFELGLRELSRVLAVRGQVLPSTLQDVVLAAELRDQSTVHGEANMHQDHASPDVDLQGRAPIERVYLVPGHAVGYPEAVQAILDADIVVVGPGSLYTSVLPNLLVKDIARALAASAAYRVFVCNVATEPGETDHYRAEDFLAAVRRHVAEPLFDAVLTNTRLDAEQPPYWHSEVVVAAGPATQGVEVLTADVVDEHNAVRHDADKLARTILRAWARQGRTTRRAPTEARMA